MFRYALIGVFMLSSAAAMADGFSYSSIQASYTDVEVGGADGNGFAVGGSVELADKWYAFADYATADLESVLDIDLTTAGAGYHHSISDKTDVFAELGYANIDLEGFGDDSGLLARVGIRHDVSESLEIYGSIGNLDFDDVDYGTEIGAGAWYTISGNMAIGLDAKFSDDIDRLSASFRLYFDK